MFNYEVQVLTALLDQPFCLVERCCLRFHVIGEFTFTYLVGPRARPCPDLEPWP